MGRWLPSRMRSPESQFAEVGGGILRAAKYLLSPGQFEIQKMSVFAESLAERLPMCIADFGRRWFELLRTYHVDNLP